MPRPKNLDVIGNNVANASTVGFKSSTAQFADVYAASMSGGGSANSVGIGTSVSSVAQQFSQGTITTTNNPLDVAINGNGFFVLSDNGTTTYSRNGQFSLNNQGYLVNSAGANVTGFPASASGGVTTGTPVNLQVSSADLPPTATSTATANVNLDSASTVSASPFNMADSTTYQGSTSMSVYDSLGDSHTLSLYFVKTASNAWNVYGANDGTQIGAGPIGTVNFLPSGAINPATTTMPLALTLPVTTGASPISMNLDLTGSTQFGSAFSANSLTQNGYAAGSLTNFSVGADGTITGNYSNGQTRAQGQIALATFVNSQGLLNLGNNQWAQTAASGAPVNGAPGSGTLGPLQSGAVEESNVDLTAELVNMITAQRDYQANAQTIKTEDQVMQTLVSLR